MAAIRLVVEGGSIFAPTVTQRLIDRFAEELAPGATVPVSLTPREREVWHLVAHGLSNAEIAEQLVVTEHTVKTHVASLLQKLRVPGRVQAVILAYESGLVRPRR